MGIGSAPAAASAAMVARATRSSLWESVVTTTRWPCVTERMSSTMRRAAAASSSA